MAEYWKAHDYDIREYLERNWTKIGTSLVGKIHVLCGDMDNYYLNLAVYLLEDYLEHRTTPPYGGYFKYGRPHEGPRLAADVERRSRARDGRPRRPQRAGGPAARGVALLSRIGLA